MWDFFHPVRINLWRDLEPSKISTDPHITKEKSAGNIEDAISLYTVIVLSKTPVRGRRKNVKNPTCVTFILQVNVMNGDKTTITPEK